MNILEAFEKSDVIKRGEAAYEVRMTKTGKGGVYLTEDELFATDWEPVIEPLTFERIKAECVPGRTLFGSSKGDKRLFLGFTRKGRLAADSYCGSYSNTWSEREIKTWQISEEEWEG